MKSRKIEARERDEVREQFNKMRDIARADRALYNTRYSQTGFYDKRAKEENARIFYKQGIFMKDFRDEYPNSAAFSSYFPNYQMMGYEQLRTYFTWRTHVRCGNVADTSLSYVFLYVYELLNNIGVDTPEEGLEKLMFFWNAFRSYDQTIDKYVINWLKDYHIYYPLPWTFKEFIVRNGLGTHYPKLMAPNDHFDALCSLSKYDIRKSRFYNDDTVNLIRDCFEYILGKLEEALQAKNLCLEQFLLQPTRNMTPWAPFKDALFHQETWQTDRQVVFNEREIYTCHRNAWMFRSTIPTESGKQMMGYVLKQMESVLRKALNYKYKLSANYNAIGSPVTELLHQAEISLEKLVTNATMDFYREATKTVVRINPETLTKIRQEALITQEKLIVPENSIANDMEGKREPAAAPVNQMVSTDQAAEAPFLSVSGNGQYEWIQESFSVNTEAASIPETSAEALPSPWEELLQALNSVERQALAILWEHQPLETGASQSGETPETAVMQFAHQQNIMPEILIDGINEKSIDIAGDNLFDEEFIFYEDYTEHVKGMVERIWQHKYPQE